MTLKTALLMILVFVMMSASIPADSINDKPTREPPSGNMAFNFHVSPSGNDANPGTPQKPFATLTRARDAVRMLKNQPDAPTHIRVALRGGVYRHEKTIVFGLADSAPEGGAIIYCSYPGERAILDGGTPVVNWQKPNEPPELLSEAAHGRVWVADLPDGMVSTRALFDHSGFLKRARGENFMIDLTRKPPKTSRNLMYLAESPLKDWSRIRDIELVSRSNAYSYDILPLKSYDQETHTLITAAPASHHLYKWLRKWNRSHLENAIELLDEPGEWVVDSGKRKLYLWPVENKKPDNVIAGRLTEIIRVEGRVNYNGPVDQPVTGLHFENLTFTHTDRLAWPADANLWSVWGASWDIADHPTCAIRFRAAEDCVLEACEFVHTGGGGARFDLHCQKNNITKNYIHHVGGSGITLCGYGLGTKHVNRDNIIRDNHIHHNGQLDLDAYGILLYQSGHNTIEHNHVHDTSYSGIGLVGYGTMCFRDDKGHNGKSKMIRYHELDNVMGWSAPIPRHEDIPESIINAVWKQQIGQHCRDNLIRRNRINDALSACYDGANIEVFPCGPDNRITENIIQGSRKSARIRCDTDHHLALVDKNLLIGSGFTTYLDNTFTNNFIINAASPYKRMPTEKARLILCVREGPTEMTRNVILLNESPLDSPYQKYKEKSRQLNDPDIKKWVQMNHNVYWSTKGENEAFKGYLEDMRAVGLETGSQVVNPMFVNPAGEDYRLKGDSPLIEMGIEGVDFKSCGLTDSFPYKQNNSTYKDEDE